MRSAQGAALAYRAPQAPADPWIRKIELDPAQLRELCQFQQHDGGDPPVNQHAGVKVKRPIRSFVALG